MKYLLTLFTMFFFSAVALAQEVAPEPDLADKIMGWLDFIPMDGAIVGGVAVVLELVLRLFKSDKPQSIMYMVARILSAVGALISRAGEFLDKVLPQRTK